MKNNNTQIYLAINKSNMNLIGENYETAFTTDVNNS